MKARVQNVLKYTDAYLTLLLFNVSRSISELLIKGLLYKGSLSRVEVACVREGGVLPSHRQQEFSADAEAGRTVALKTYEKQKLSHRSR